MCFIVGVYSLVVVGVEFRLYVAVYAPFSGDESRRELSVDYGCSVAEHDFVTVVSLQVNEFSCLINKRNVNLAFRHIFLSFIS